MDYGFSVLMFIFAGAILLYAAILAITKDYNMLPYRSRVSMKKPRHSEKYAVKVAKILALVAAGIAVGAAVALWNAGVGAVVMVAGVIAAIRFGSKGWDEFV